MHTAEAPTAVTVLMRRRSASRLTTAATSAPQDDARKVSALWWAVPCFAAWCALIWWLA